MNERDDDVVKSGRARSHRVWLVVTAVWLMGAAWALSAVPADQMPPSWVAALLPGASSDLDVLGGAHVTVRTRSGAAFDEAARATVVARLGPIGGNLVDDAGDRLIISVAGDEGPALLERVLRPGRLELMEVEEGSALMRKLYARVGATDDPGSAMDPRAAELGIVAEVDAWSHEETGQDHGDWYLAADSPEALETYLREVARAEPSLRPAPGFRLALEESAFGDASRAWRTYYLLDRAAIDNRHIAGAQVYWNEMTGLPEVLVELTGDGAERFADWTGRIAGKKLAIVLDGVVTTAPVVQARITGGGATIQMGSGTVQEKEQEATALAAVLGTRPLGVETELERVETVEPVVSDAELQLARALLAALVGLILAAPLALLSRLVQPVDPRVAPAGTHARRRSLPWSRGAVTVVGTLLAAASGYVLLPGLDREEVAVLAESGPYGPLSLFALGVQPFLSAFLLVELVALAVPRWRALRTGGPTARARLGSATVGAGLVLALVQSWFVATWLGELAQGPSLTVSPPFALAVLSLAAGSTLLALLALVIDRHGLGNGFVAVFLADVAVEGRVLLRGLGHDDTPVETRVAMVVGIGLIVVLTSIVVRLRLPRPAAPGGFRLPTAGLFPLAWATAAVTVLSFWPGATASLTEWLQGGGRAGASPALHLLVLVALSLIASWLFSRPSGVGVTATAVDPAGARLLWLGFAAATGASTVYLLALFGIEELGVAWGGSWIVSVAAIALATAAAMDLVAEWRATWRRGDLVPLWPMHQVQLVEPVVAALARIGIDAHARGLYARSMLHFFGPHVPIVLWVPRGRADEARQVISTQLGLDGSG
jgi:SecY